MTDLHGSADLSVRNRHLDEDVCLDLAAGLLDPERCATALGHAAACPACEQLLRERIAAWEGTRARHALIVQTDGSLAIGGPATHPAIAAEPRQPVGGEGAPSWRRWFRLAGVRVAVAMASLTLIAFGLHRIDPGGGASDLQVQMLPRFSEDVQLRSVVEQSRNDALHAGLQAYARSDFRTAVDRLASTTLSEQYEQVRRIYLASALAHLHRYEEAIATLDGVALAVLPDPWGSEASWTFFVALQETGRESRADSVAADLAAGQGAVGDRARRWLTR